MYRRRAVRFVAGSARDAGDAALILEALGLDPVEGRDGTEKVDLALNGGNCYSAEQMLRLAVASVAHATLALAAAHGAHLPPPSLTIQGFKAASDAAL